MPLNIDLNVPFTFTDEHSISDNDTTIPSNVETQYQNSSLEDETNSTDSRSNENGV